MSCFDLPRAAVSILKVIDQGPLTDIASRLCRTSFFRHSADHE